MTEIKLPSGAILKIGTIPFAESIALNEAILKEMKDIPFNSQVEMGTLYKNLLCVGFSSELIKSALWKCMGRCSYNSGKGNLKITQDTFEPEECRQDYATVCMEVSKSAILPFVKHHSAEFFQILGALQGSQGSNPQTTPS